MKKISFCLLFIAAIIASCQKDNTITNEVTTENLTNTATSRSESDQFRYFHNGVEIDETGFAAIMENTHNIIDIEALPENTDVRVFNAHAFDTEEQYIAFGNTLNLRLDREITAAEHLHQYALEHGVIAHYEATGEILPSYEAYMQEYLTNLQGLKGKSSSRAVSFLKKSCSNPGLPLPFLTGGMAFMPPTWNNEVSEITSVNLLFGSMVIFDTGFFTKRLTTFTTSNPIFSGTTICFTSLPAPLNSLLDNRMSSGLNLTL